MGNSFFDTNVYFIDEKVNFFKFENEYKIYDEKGEKIGAVMQIVPLWQKVIRVLVSKKMLPFTLDIMDNNNNIQATITRGWTFFNSEIEISDGQGRQIGSIKQKFAFLKPKFNIFDMSENLVAVIKGDWKAWNFQIKDSSENEIGVITKKWNGLVKEMFTSADKYNVTINPTYSDNVSKVIIVASAITLDMVLKESK